MLTILKNNYARMFQRLSPVLLMTTIMLVSIALAVYITSTQQVKAHIVYVTNQKISIPNSKELSIVLAKNKPPRSALVKQQYDAYIIDQGNGKLEIDTLKNNAFKAMLMSMIKNPHKIISDYKMERGVGVNIIGFLMMFLLMGTFMHLFTFADDKEQGQLVRVISTPISFLSYLAAHCIYCLSMYLPAYIMLVIMKLIGFNIGFTLLQYALFFLLIGTLGISFSLLLNTNLKKPDNASMLGNSIIVLTSILAGSFYSFSKDNKILDTIIKILPQKQILNFAQYIQNGQAFQHIACMVYVLLLTIAMFIISIIILRMKYIKRV